MANTIALNNAYNHFVSAYPGLNNVSKYDSHKKSELRNVYNSMVKLNKESPLYLYKNDSASREFAVGLKEGARELHNAIVDIGGGLDDEALINKKVAFSNNEDIVSVSYIGESTDTESIPSYNIEVKSLATNQVNLGFYLPTGSTGLEAGTYSFDINTRNLNYEFQYNVSENDTNRSIQEKLARLITKANIGINAEVVDSANGQLSALQLSSTTCGLPGGKEALFTISDDNTSKTSGSVDYLGIGEITDPATNAEVVINGTTKLVPSNHFTLEKTYEITLNGISPTEGQTAEITVKNDAESVGKNLNKLAESYNTFLAELAGFPPVGNKGSNLISEVQKIAANYSVGLDQVGLDFDEDGQLTVDADQYKHVVENSTDPRTAFQSVQDFANSLLRKTNQISLNPMEYVNKTLVAYKNPNGANYATPYITSNYSGMLFNSYC